VPPPAIDFTAPRPLAARAADALHVLGMARAALKAADIDHRRSDVREIEALLWVAQDSLRRGLEDEAAKTRHSERR
jgi:hypothetical protein